MTAIKHAASGETTADNLHKAVILGTWLVLSGEAGPNTDTGKADIGAKTDPAPSAFRAAATEVIPGQLSFAWGLSHCRAILVMFPFLPPARHPKCHEPCKGRVNQTAAQQHDVVH